MESPKNLEKKSKFSFNDVLEFFRRYIRILKLSQQPTKSEFYKISAISAAGIVIVGTIGFIIYLICKYLLNPIA
ncbi:MAG TPA: protein translocase SEC61 complex subunit gamma [Methanocorpusculum sp.]|nr:protein translocase SEC61 complex subunit gamma [Methanocorpusculum sp.]